MEYIEGAMEHVSMKQAQKTPKKMDGELRVRVPQWLKDRLAEIASRRQVGPTEKTVTASDVAREYLAQAAEVKNGKKKAA